MSGRSAGERLRALLAGPASLRGRLSLVAVLVTAVFLGLLTVGVQLLLDRQLLAGADDLLRSRAETASTVVAIAPDGRVRLRDPVDARAFAELTWVYEGTVAVERPRATDPVQRAADGLAGTGARLVSVRGQEDVRLYALPLRAGGRQVGTVVSSVDLAPYDRVGDLALVATSALAVLVLGGAYLLTRVVVARALDPVAQMTEQAAQWSASDLERRFGAGRRPAELAALAATLDGLLERLAAVLRHEQQLSAELSHELRTPLSAVVAEVDLLTSRPRGPQELAAAHEAIAAAAERMRRVIESLLTAERASTAALPGRCEVLPAVCAAVASVGADDPRMRVEPGPPGLWAGVDAALLERALAPVLDNALRHAASRVVVRVGADRDGPWVDVRDDGPGVDAGVADTVFAPGVRGPGSTGSGLGLALARRLARAGDGELALEPDGPGARFVLRLPSA